MLRRTFISIFGTGLLLSASAIPAAEGIKVGATAGPHAAIVTEAAKVAARLGLQVKVVEFSDYITPNIALNDGALDVVVYQHEPFLNNFNKNRGTKIKKIADAVVQPMGLYSNSIHSLAAIPEKAVVSIPNDPTNSGRALVLLQAAGLIGLRSGVTGTTATVRDITSNPKKLRIVELEAAQLPRSISDVTFTAIPMNYVISAGLSPEKQGFYFESRKAPFALMVIASRQDNAADPSVQKFIRAYQSEQVRQYIAKTFKGAVQPAW